MPTWVDVVRSAVDLPEVEQSSSHDSASILVDLAAVQADQSAEMVTEAWRLRAPVRLRKAFDAV